MADPNPVDLNLAPNLAPNLLDSLHRDGYAILPRVLDRAAIDELVAALAPYEAGRPMGRNSFEGERSQRVYSLAGKGDVFRRLIEHPVVLGLLDRLLLPNFLLSTAQSIRLHAGAKGGDYIWHDARGWHVRVTHHGSGKVIFAGKIVSSAPMTVTPFRLENRDGITLSADKLTLTYRFRNYGRIDGFDVKTNCAQRLVIASSMAGHKLPVGRIWLGRQGVHPLENRFVLVKVV